MKRIFIYGSCVTRDAEPWFQDYGLEKAGYIARQSLISSHRKANLSEFDLGGIKSNFQRRMTMGDIQGNLFSEIRRAEPEAVFWDICDERLGVKTVASGGMVTHSRDHIADGIHSGPFGDMIHFGTDPHFDLWKRGLRELLSSLESIDLASRLVINATPWAVVDEFGKINQKRMESAEKFNSGSVRYLQYAEDNGVCVARLPQSMATSRTAGHQWGPAAFHYIDETYQAMVKNLANALKSIS
ncbi:DUF6270 domain-containing protein [Glutamicibacter sp. 287]|uniref:DUF6270 domain-containing protein n=1 Tax=Glutamicibacter sp. 287 TaxID=3457732 RepID=UPI0040346977